MATQRRPTPERRAALRIKVHLGCRFTFKGIEHQAFIKDISPIGAFLWSAFMPPPAADLSIKVDTSFTKTPLILESRVVRRDCKSTGQATVGVFAVKFSQNSPGLLLLLNKLGKPQSL